MNLNTDSYTENHISLDLTGLKFRKYGVSVKYYNGDEQIPDKRIDYETEIIITPYNKAWLLDINKENIFFNNHEPDLITEDITTHVSKCIYPLQTAVDEYGLKINNLTNYNQIVNRWEKKKNLLKSKYQGDVINLFLKNLDSKFKNRLTFEKNVTRYDMFWNLFFHPKYFEYKANKELKIDLDLSLIPYETPIKFSGTQRLTQEKTDYDSHTIHFISDTHDANSKFFLKNKEFGEFKMSLEVFFDLDIRHYFAMHTRAYFKIFKYNDKGEELIHRKIQFTMFQTNEEEIKPKQKTGKFEVTTIEEKNIMLKKKKKSFMDIIYDILGG